MAKEFKKGKMVPVPSHSIVPERDVNKLPVLECQHLGIDFGGLTAVNEFNLTIGRTEIAGLIGPNGAGKTTVFNLLTKVYQPTRGTILLNGKDTHGMSTAQVNRAGIARTFQNIRLFSNLSVEDNVKIGLHNQIRYPMWDGVLRLPKFWKQEKLARESAMELLSIFDMQDLAHHQAGGVHVPLAGGEHLIPRHQLCAVGEVAQLQPPLLHQGKIPLQHPGAVGPGDDAAHLHAGVDDRTYGGGVAAHLGHHAHQHAGGGDDAVPRLEPRLLPLAQGEGGLPVGGRARRDLGRLKGEVLPLGPQAQQLPEAGVLLNGLLPLPELALQLGHLLLQVLELLLHLSIMEHIAGHAAGPVGNGAHSVPDRRGDGAYQVGEWVGVAPHQGGGNADEHTEQKGDDQQPEPVSAKKVLHSARSFSAASARGSIPKRASIRPSRHTGRPTTLK